MGSSSTPRTSQRGQLAGRPRVPWQAGKGGRRETSDLEAWARLVSALLVVTNPITAAVTAVAVFLGSWLRVRGWWFLAAGAVLGAGTYLTGRWSGYGLPWAELRESFGSAATLSGSVEAMRAVAGDRWPAWVSAQLPVAGTVALLFAGTLLVRRRRYQAAWRERPAAPRRGAVERALADAGREEPRRQRRPLRAAPTGQLRDLQVRLGADLDSGEVAALPVVALAMHAVVAGATGFGKSVTLMKIAYELVGTPAARAHRVPVVFLDMKADPELVEFLRWLAGRAGRRFWHVTNTGEGSTYNPLRHGTAQQMRSKLIEAEANASDGGFSEPHHRRVAERFLLLACKVLEDLVKSRATRTVRGQRRPWRRDLVDLVALLDPAALSGVQPQLSAAAAADVAEYLRWLETKKDLERSITGIHERYANVAEGAAGDVLVEDPAGLDLYRAITDGDVVLFSLDAAADAASARQLGNLAVQDLTLLGSKLQREGFRVERFGWVVVDEFSALGGSLLLALYARLRAAGLGVCLATQDVADLRAVSEQFERAVLTNANVIVLHRQKGASASERAEAFGTDEAWEETVQVLEDTDALGSRTAGSGQGSLRLVDKFRVHPNELKNLEQGVAVVAVDHPTTSLRRVKIARVDMGAEPTGGAGVKTEPRPRPVASEEAGPGPAQDADRRAGSIAGPAAPASPPARAGGEVTGAGAPVPGERAGLDADFDDMPVDGIPQEHD